MKPFTDSSDRMDHYRPHLKSSLDERLLSRILVCRWGWVGEFLCYGVDGEALRNSGADLDFTTGGNPGRYRYVSPPEIWFEQVLRPSDALGVIIHEAIETIYMVSLGMSYDDAHAKANEHEWRVRQAIASGQLLVPSYQEAVQMADLWVSDAAQQIIPPLKPGL